MQRALQRLLCVMVTTWLVIATVDATRNLTSRRRRMRRNEFCDDLPGVVLTEILGPAFNPRYMSVDEPPPQEDEEDLGMGNQKRKAGIVPSFYVEDGYAQPLSDEPAWNLNDHQMYKSDAEVASSRAKRSPRQLRQWECLSRIRWIDLGKDYFPRYLRSVECTSTNCWYGHFKCKAKSFTVKILRRRRGRCVRSAPGTKVGVNGLPMDLRQLWVWEERAVNFCCECSVD